MSPGTGSRSRKATAFGAAVSFGWLTTYVQVQLRGFVQGVVNGGSEAVLVVWGLEVSAAVPVKVEVGWAVEGPGPGWRDDIFEAGARCVSTLRWRSNGLFSARGFRACCFIRPESSGRSRARRYLRHHHRRPQSQASRIGFAKAPARLGEAGARPFVLLRDAMAGAGQAFVWTAGENPTGHDGENTRPRSRRWTVWERNAVMAEESQDEAAATLNKY